MYFWENAGLMLGTVKEEWSDRFVLSSEEYLHGTINLVNDLVSFCVLCDNPILMTATSLG